MQAANRTSVHSASSRGIQAQGSDPEVSFYHSADAFLLAELRERCRVAWTMVYVDVHDASA